MEPQDSGGTIQPVHQWPVWTPNALPSGEPAMEYSWLGAGDFDCTLMQHRFPAQPDKPLASDTPYFATAVVKPKSVRGGFIFTQRFTLPDMEMCLRRWTSVDQVVISSATNSFNYYTPLVDYTGQTLVCTWMYNGSAENPQALVRINGANIALIPWQGGLIPYAGASGLSVGYCNAVFEGFDGFIGDVRAYLGLDMSTMLASEQWSANFAGVSW